MFETVRLQGHYLDIFAHLDPYEYLEYGKLPDRVCIGTVLRGKGEKKDMPIGLMICRLKEDTLVAEWIFVDGNYRTLGVGARLMRCLFEEARKRHFDNVYAYLYLNRKRDRVCPDEVRFLKEYNMSLIMPSRNTKSLYKNYIPKELDGAYLYCTDVNGYFEKMEMFKKLTDQL